MLREGACKGALSLFVAGYIPGRLIVDEDLMG
jgi:hypothetical protein